MGRRAWAQHAMEWGMWHIPEAQIRAIPDVDGRDVLELLRNGVLFSLCAPDSEDPAGDRLLRPYFGLHRLEWTDDGSINFSLGIGPLIRLFRECGFELIDCIELQAPAGRTTRFKYLTPEWAHRWPSEEIWRVRKRG